MKSNIVLFEEFIKPSNYVKFKLIGIIDELLEKYHGGRPFFHALDDAIASFVNRQIIIELMNNHTNDRVIASGGFGNILYEMYNRSEISCKELIMFNGKMKTDGIGVTGYIPQDADLHNKTFIFVDDSYFSGMTVNTISNYLSQYNSKISKISVVYDGSYSKNPIVNSFFRYYDNYKSLN